MSKTFSFLKLFGKYLDIKSTFNEIKSNPEAKQSSTLLGKKAIWYNVWFLVTAAACVALMYFCISSVSSGNIFAIIGIIFGVLTIICSLSFLLLALVCTICQLRLNKKPIGWVSLALLIVILASLTVATVILLS